MNYMTLFDLKHTLNTVHPNAHQYMVSFGSNVALRLEHTIKKYNQI